MNNPKISIITICFNSKNTIKQTIVSVLKQTYDNIEYIIIDGQSTDGTLQILEEFKGKKNLQIFSEKDEGLYDALNKGIKKATGEIITWIHSDDEYSDENVISNVVKEFEVNIDGVCGKISIFKPNENKPFRIYKSTNFKPWQMKFGIQPPHTGFFITKKAFEKVGFYMTFYKVSGDFDWLVRVYLIEKLNIKHIGLNIVNMKDGGVSNTLKNKNTMNKEALKSLKKHNIYSNTLFIYLKYLIKIFQFRF